MFEKLVLIISRETTKLTKEKIINYPVAVEAVNETNETMCLSCHVCGYSDCCNLHHLHKISIVGVQIYHISGVVTLFSNTQSWTPVTHMISIILHGTPQLR